MFLKSVLAYFCAIVGSRGFSRVFVRYWLFFNLHSAFSLQNQNPLKRVLPTAFTFSIPFVLFCFSISGFTLLSSSFFNLSSSIGLGRWALGNWVLEIGHSIFNLSLSPFSFLLLYLIPLYPYTSLPCILKFTIQFLIITTVIILPFARDERVAVLPYHVFPLPLFRDNRWYNATRGFLRVPGRIVSLNTTLPPGSGAPGVRW